MREGRHGHGGHRGHRNEFFDKRLELSRRYSLPMDEQTQKKRQTRRRNPQSVAGKR